MITTDKLITSDDPKGRRATDLFRGVYDKAKLTEEGAQRLNENEGSEFTNELLLLIQKHSATNRYAKEVVGSTYTYPNEYKGPKPIVEQVETIAEMFGFDPTKALEFAKKLPALPVGAEGWFAIPRVEAIGGKFFPETTDPVERYCRAVDFVLGKIGDSRKFHNYRSGEIDKQHLRGSSRTIAKFSEIKQQQPEGDILIIPAQLGMRHRGKSANRARETFAGDEFGLGAFMVCVIALTHPERFVRTEELDIIIPGDEFAPGGDGVFSRVLYLFFSDDEVGFGTFDVSDADEYYGSASGFVPQIES